MSILVGLNFIHGHYITGLDAPYGELNFINRPTNWSMAQHRHPYFQFLLVLSGELSVFAGDNEDDPAPLSRGMVSIVPPGVPHRLQSIKGYKQFGINLTADAPDDNLIKILSVNITTPAEINIPALLDIVPEIEDCSRLRTLVAVQKIRNHMEYMLLACVDMLKKQDGSQAFKEKLMCFLNDKILENLTLEGISRHLSLSPTHVERQAYLEFGCGAISLFHHLKIDRARILLNTTDLAISEIADHLGYKDQSYFSRLFKKYTKVSPLSYKKGRAAIPVNRL
ncbi:transcriptional regulator [Spirochaetia bacterium]|nr:transcriptional regulator [Spirochaetia bacterium]